MVTENSSCSDDDGSKSGNGHDRNCQSSRSCGNFGIRSGGTAGLILVAMMAIMKAESGGSGGNDSRQSRCGICSDVRRHWQ